MITNKSDSHKWLYIKVIVTMITNPVVLIFLKVTFKLILQKDFTSTKKHKTAYSKQKLKMRIKNI